jgi:hypothetical protein
MFGTQKVLSGPIQTMADSRSPFGEAFPVGECCETATTPAFVGSEAPRASAGNPGNAAHGQRWRIPLRSRGRQLCGVSKCL